MLENINLPLIIAAGFIAAVSPGPATLALAGTSMKNGRPAGLALAAGITTGSWMWSVAAAFGFGAVMLANVWLAEAVRYFGVAYLTYLAFKAGRAALSTKEVELKAKSGSLRKIYSKGLALHLTNPKAILFFGSLYAIGLPQGATLEQLVLVIVCIGLQSMIVFHCYAFLFSMAPVVDAYVRFRRWFEGLFAIGFGYASFKILMARLQ
jgi:threonine/homoserine/homoserine lactone efflux protein